MLLFYEKASPTCGTSRRERYYCRLSFTPLALRPSRSFTLISLLQILSLDVVLGAGVSTVFVAKFLVASIPYVSLLALCACVWLIYTADHLMDAYALGYKVAHTARHRYHQTRFKMLALAWGIIALFGIGILFYLPSKLIFYGSLLAVTVILYALLIKYTTLRTWVPKELATALFYTTGVFLPAMAIHGASLPWSASVLFVQYFLLALANLLLFSWFETDTDRQDGYPSFALSVGRPRVRRLIYGCLAAVGVSSVAFVTLVATSRATGVGQATVLMMALVLLVLVRWPSYFRRHERYRLLGDGIFVLPVIPLLLL
jgi:4-hydroxybenzoate polyprenyltransferase